MDEKWIKLKCNIVTAMAMETVFFWNVTSWSLFDAIRRLGKHDAPILHPEDGGSAFSKIYGAIYQEISLIMDLSCSK
jgi:hypothetical protein